MRSKELARQCRPSQPGYLEPPQLQLPRLRTLKLDRRRAEEQVSVPPEKRVWRQQRLAPVVGSDQAELLCDALKEHRLFFGYIHVRSQELRHSFCSGIQAANQERLAKGAIERLSEWEMSNLDLD